MYNAYLNPNKLPGYLKGTKVSKDSSFKKLLNIIMTTYFVMKLWSLEVIFQEAEKVQREDESSIRQAPSR